MDDNFIEAAEASIMARTASQIELVSRKAISSEDLSPEEFIVTECDECGDDLPFFRMQKGLRLCVACQSKLERR